MPFRSEQQIPRRRAGEKLSAILNNPDTFNAPADDLASVKEHIGRNLGPDPFDWPVVDHFLGKIYQTSLNPNYPNDPRYQVQRVQPKWSLVKNDLLTTEEDKREETQNRIVIATNLSESATSHSLATNTIVHVFGVVMEKNSPVIHYFFVSGGIAGMFPVALTKTGGTDGDSVTAPSYTYTVKTIDSVTTLGTGVGLDSARPFGSFAPGTKGMAYYLSTTLKLMWADETENVDLCDETP